MHQYLVPLLAFTLTSALFTLTPGLDTVLTLRMATAEGRKAGLGAVAGICAGLSVWGVAAALGLTALLRASDTAFLAVKCIGAAYLAWLGIGLLLRPRSVLTPARSPAGTKQTIKAQASFGQGFSRGLLCNLLNPKVGVFVVTFFPQFIPAHVNTALFTLLLVGVQIALSMIWLGALVFLVAPLGRLLTRPSVVRRLDRLTGIVFLGFGAKLLLSRS